MVDELTMILKFLCIAGIAFILIAICYYYFFKQKCKKTLDSRYEHLLSCSKEMQIDNIDVTAEKEIYCETNNGYEWVFYNSYLVFKTNNCNTPVETYMRKIVQCSQETFKESTLHRNTEAVKIYIRFEYEHPNTKSKDKFGNIYNVTCIDTYTILLSDIMKINEPNISDEKLIGLFETEAIKNKIDSIEV